jgi:endonuclease/exonuclease/phosphatase family metal-dependent hydrolase
MTYNLLNYVSTNASRDEYYKTVINATKPDILVVQEITSQEAVNNFLNNVVNTAGLGSYEKGEFKDGPDSDNAIFLKLGRIAFVSNTSVTTALRDITEFKLYHTASAETLRIYSAHLKASSGSDNEAKRAAEVDSVRKVTDALGVGKNFLMLGDFNIYGSTEPAYQKLLQVKQGSEGHFLDAITMTGTWNNPAYAQYHTQSPRVRSFGGGSTGGLDDRFDLILYSKAVSESGGITYIPGSMTAFGNDGKHYNDSINKMPNEAVSVDVANALHYASDHLPVTALFEFRKNPDVAVNDDGIIKEGFRLHQNYPNPFNPRTTIEFSVGTHGHTSLRIVDMLGREVAVIVDGERSPGVYKVGWDASALPSGIYFYRMQTGSFTETKKMVLTR